MPGLGFGRAFGDWVWVCLVFRVKGLWVCLVFRVKGLGIRVWGLGFW